MNTFIWFCYHKKESALRESIRSFVINSNIPMKIVLVFDNVYGHLPSKETLALLYEIKNKLKIPCVVLLTKFDRVGNLNGRICVSNMYDIFSSLAKDIDANEAIFKVDDDIILFKDDSVRQFLNSDSLVFGLGRNPTSEIEGDIEPNMWGAFYGLKKGFIKILEKNISISGSATAFLNKVDKIYQNALTALMFPEDIALSYVVKATVSKENRMLLPLSMDGGLMAGWQYQDAPYSFYYNMYELVNFGNMALLKGEPDSIGRLTRTMRDALNEYLITNQKPDTLNHD